jgi:hypothetical protein
MRRMFTDFLKKYKRKKIQPITYWAPERKSGEEIQWKKKSGIR